MIYFLTLLLTISIGIYCVRIITKNQLSSELNFLLGGALGLGVTSQLIFYIQLLFNNFSHFLPPTVGIITLIGLWLLDQNNKKKVAFWPRDKRLLILIPIAIALFLEGRFFLHGGWDAWSCWNLKAKFIYWAETNWKDMFSPLLWRSNTGYPLALPTINNWFWQFSGYSVDTAMYTAIILSLLTAGLLLTGLINLRVKPLYAILLTLAIFSLAFGNTLCISQYSDILFSLYLLAVFVLLMLYHDKKNEGLLILAAVFIGLLSFTKNEGMAASFVLTVLLILQQSTGKMKLLGWVLAAAVPTLLFQFLMAPHSDAFINGFLSKNHPTSFDRLLFIFAYTLNELISLKWMGLWILAILGIGMGYKKSFVKPLSYIGIFLSSYMAITIGYYLTNTFFYDIAWWMGVSLNRILFALMPTVFLWVGLSLFKDA